MPYTPIRPLHETMHTTFHNAGGTPAGVRVQLPVPWRGFITEVGFSPTSLCSTNMTLAVAYSDNGASSTASAFTQFVTSTVGTFSSLNLQEGRVASVQGLQQQVNEGDMIQFSCSGGATTLIGTTVYFKIRRD